MSRTQIPAPQHQLGDTLHGFQITAITPIEDIKALVYEATHLATGAHLLHVHCHDEENMFSIGFRTPPSDSTGVAHILEHSVLAGSARYPVKDAFNELRKRTMSTFLNAMTWPDRTIYPVASAVRADYFNLAAVYADLVFNPLIAEKTFRQEGHHLELEDLDDPTSPLKVTGVVYNEMKGVYSSPDSVVGRSCNNELLPDTPYGHDSGGDPEAIPDLTYDDFKAFHARFYSPSNARFFLYGDISLHDNLAFIHDILAPFSRRDVDSSIPLQPRWTEPRRTHIQYTVDPEDESDGKSFVVLNWLVGQTRDALDTLLIEVAISAIYGSSAGPLKQALIDSGLGKDIFPHGGFDADIQETTAAFGLRGTEADQVQTIEALVLDTLRDIIQKGIDPQLLEATFHQVEFGGKEIVPPFPIMLLMRANPAWYFGGDPKDGLSFTSLVEAARQRWAEEPRLFERLLQEHLLDNPHRLTVVATPSPTLSDEQDQRLADRLAKLKQGLSDDEISAIAAEARALKAEQEAPDDPQALASLPALDLQTLPRRVRNVHERHTVAGSTAKVDTYEHEVFSNDVGYLALAFNTDDLSHEDALLLPFLGRATNGMGAGGLSYDAQIRRVALYTGGIGASPSTGTHLRSNRRYEHLNVSTKVLRRNAEPLFQILLDTLTAPDTTDIKRLFDLLQESATGMEASVVPSGHAYAYTRAAAGLSPTHFRAEQWGGLTQLRFLKRFAAQGRDGAAALAQRIADLQRRIFTRDRLTVDVAGDPEVLDALRPHLNAFLDALPAGAPSAPADEAVPHLHNATAVIIPAQVNYVGQILTVPDYLHEAAPALELLTQLISSEYLYKKVRVQGGAYGGFAFYQKTSGTLPLVSYRDPNLTETLDVYKALGAYLTSDAISDDAVDSVRTGAVGEFDQILSPAQQLGVARSRRLLGLTEADRLAFRDGILHATADDLRDKAVPLLQQALAQPTPIAVLGGRARVEGAAAQGYDLQIESIDGTP